MATCRDVIRSAFRRSGVRAAGVRLTATENDVGLERLKGMYLNFLATGLLGQLTDYYLGVAANASHGTYTALENQRIFKADVTITITIPTFVKDCSTGLNRAPLDGSVIVIANPNASPPVLTIYLYDALGGWQVISDLVPASFAPMSGRYEENIKDILAVMLCDEYGLPVTPVLARNAGMAKLTIASKYDQPRKRANPDYF